jgi:hypothetical protein
VARRYGLHSRDIQVGSIESQRKLSGVPIKRAPSKNKTLKQTKVLTESDVDLSSPPSPELAQLSDAQLNSLEIDTSST